jgi:hypothetical protein
MPAGPQSGVDEKEAKYLSMFAPAAPVPAPKFAPQQPVRAVAPQPLIQQAPVQPVIQQPAPAFQYPVQQPAQPAQPILQPVQPQPAPVAIPVAAPQAQFIPQQPLAQMQPTQPAMPIPVQNMQPVMPVQAPITPPQPIMPQQQPVMAQPAPMPAPQAQIPQPIKPGPGVPVASEFPNLVSGIIKDSRGNVLSGILLEVKNKNGESVRAFKTNALGQFASATQITNGSYTIEFEDPKKQHTFAKIAVEANGSIILPLEIISTDGREELRKELFG